VYFLLNSWLIAIAVGLEQRSSPFEVWRKNFLWLSLNYFSGASVAALLLPYLQTPGYTLIRVIGVLLPILLISYLTLKTALGRVEDANKHLAELNRLYLSTIETLAMAIDAKDQITHGHIRRVQIFAVGLARAMGLTDGAQIKAVEAAALLHDMGKLAVPEYILNKPGPLTSGEFEKMKLHASVGADILSAIDFPYPVVPIVRHHHENWDGRGYPDGLKGADIPIGARILSVVDCFDALTSDRPYRPRLSDADALRILVERRETMYDPLVVDTFVRVYRDIAPTDEETLQRSGGLSAITRGAVETLDSVDSVNSRLEDISASTEEMLLLYEMARGLSGSISDVTDLISKHLRRLVPATTCVFFVYDPTLDCIRVAHASGENASHFSDIHVAMGQRLSGWVAANRQTILNSDPMLDLGEIARILKPPLRSCLSTPLLNDDQLVGVLTVYSTHRQAFTEDHRRIVEVVARQVSKTIGRDIDDKKGPATQLRDATSGLPNRRHLERFLVSEISSGTGLPCSLVLVETTLKARAAQTSFNATSIAATIRPALRGADILFLCDSNRFVALLTQTNADTSASMGRRIASELAGARSAEDTYVFRLGCATAPDDGLSLEELIRTAENRLTLVVVPGRPSVH
jgi:putative nucleotidyltransferase with HDIG domain